jgi:uncharacterized membrane protein
LVALSAVCAAVVAAGWHSPVRVVVAIAFVLIVPGLAAAELLDIHELMQKLSVATAASLSIDALVAMILLYARLWSIGRALAILIALTMLMLAGAAARVWRDPAAGGR